MGVVVILKLWQQPEANSASLLVAPLPGFFSLLLRAPGEEPNLFEHPGPLSLGLLSLVGKEGPGISSLVLLVWVVVLTRAPAKWLSPLCFFQLCHIAPSPSLPKKDGNGILCSLFTVLPHACGFPPKLARISAQGASLVSLKISAQCLLACHSV